MNENSRDRKIDEKSILRNMTTIHKNLNFYAYSFLNLFSINRDNFKENYMDYKYRFKPVEVIFGNTQTHERKSSVNSSSNNLTIENYPAKIKSYFENICKYICFMACELNKLNTIINNPENLSVNINNYKDQESSNNGSQIISKVNLLSLLFYDMIIYNEDAILREYLSGEVKMEPRNYFLYLQSSNQLNQNNKQIFKNTQLLEDEIKKVINDIFPNNYSYYFHIGQEKTSLTIDNFPFKVILEISNIPRDNKNTISYKVLVFGFYENNGRRLKDTSNFLLYEKIRSLFQNKLKLIYFYVNDMCRRDLQNKGELILFLTITEFLKYMCDYDKIFNTECKICNKCIRYSLTEKCFFPPYYKIIDFSKIKNQLITKQKPNNNSSEKTEKYNYSNFVHEECIKRLAVPSL